MDKQQNATQANQPIEPEPGFFYSFFYWLSFIYTSVITFFKSLFSSKPTEPNLATEQEVYSNSEVQKEDDPVVAAEPTIVPEADPVPESKPVEQPTQSVKSSSASQSDAKPLYTRQDSQRVVEKHQSNPEPENYHQFLCTLSDEELTSYVQHLDEKELHFHYKTEGQLAKLTSKTNLDIIAKRLLVVLPLLESQQVRQLSLCDQFWILADKLPSELATRLNVSCLEVLSKDGKHARDFKKIVSHLPEDEFLFDKLLAVAPQITQDAEHEFTMKTMRLIRNTPKEQRKGLQDQLHHAMPLKQRKSVGSAVSVRTQFNQKSTPPGEVHDALTKSASSRV